MNRSRGETIFSFKPSRSSIGFHAVYCNGNSPFAVMTSSPGFHVSAYATAATPALAAETLNAYSIWPENWARPMFEEFEKATRIKVNFVRFSSGEALARVIAEKNNPQVDVLFGGPVETFAGFEHFLLGVELARDFGIEVEALRHARDRLHACL